MFPRRITFVTNPQRCNLSCRDCFRLQMPLDWVTQAEMDFSLVEKVARAFAPLGLRELVPSTCGEPLLYTHFAAFLRLAADLNLKVNITTNGTFPGGVERWMPLLLPVLSDMKISVMGASDAVNGALMQGIDPVQQRRNILQCLAARDAYRKACPSSAPTISLQMTVRPENRHEVDDLRSWAVRVGVDRVKVHDLWWLCSERFEPAQGVCPFLGKEAWVWVDGSFQVCPNPDVRYASRCAQPFGALGNFIHDDPVQVWNAQVYQDLCATYTHHRHCRFCPMRISS